MHSPSRPPAPANSVTVVIPTLREVENLAELLDRIAKVRDERELALDVVIVDDDSRDGTAELVAERGLQWVQLVTRTEQLGLSHAVVEGFQRSHGDVLVCMHADLSHPPERVPELVAALDGYDIVIGSRYVEGGTTSEDWGLVKWLSGRMATLLSRPFTSVADPMSGYFALRRSTFEMVTDLNPAGHKIALELIVRGRYDRVAEVPIHFEGRRRGQTKLALKERLQFIQHLRRLFIFKYGVWSHLVQFLVVGALGTVVNLVLLTACVAVGMPEPWAIGVAIFLSMVFNFVLNRRFSFSYARQGAWFRQFLGFTGACSFGALINYATTVWLRAEYAHVPVQLAALAGIAAGTAVNFLMNQYLVFRVKHVRPKLDDGAGAGRA